MIEPPVMKKLPLVETFVMKGAKNGNLFHSIPRFADQAILPMFLPANSGFTRLIRHLPSAKTLLLASFSGEAKYILPGRPGKDQV